MSPVDKIPRTLNPQSPIPLYRQLADILSAMIRGGGYPVASRIPSENRLAEEFGIGRPTVRQATDYLIRKGLLLRKRGSGTYVCARTKEVDLFSLGGTLSAFQSKGIDVDIRIRGNIKQIVVPDGADNPFSGQHAYFLSRVSSVEGVPLLLEEIYLSALLFPGIGAMDLSGRSISRIVEEIYYMHPSGGKQTFSIGNPGSERALQLDISPRTSVLVVKRFLHFPQTDNGIYAELFCITDRFAFSQNLGISTGWAL
jgi:GntR family transcriptional regulator